MFNKKSNIIIVGAGKIAYSLTNALIKAGYNVDTIISRKLSSAKLLAKRFQIQNFYNDLGSIPKKSQIFFLSVPDTKIEEVARKLSKQNFDFKDSLFIHLSGALNIDVLKNLKKKHSKTASFHILQSFPAKKIIELSGNYAAIETGEAVTKKFMFNLAGDLDMLSFEIKSSEKSNYHLASVLSSNFLVINMFIANQIYENENFIDILYPIMLRTLQNTKNLGVSNALSGPIDRGDLKTIKNHLAAIKKIKNNNSDLIYKSYIMQSLSGLELVKKKYAKLSKEHQETKEYLTRKLDSIS
jgi:predicted short-subunit dehydrogenase-like oxidoreductase (DUF2520 family)